jgi:putative exosortase-associated protein (TIGR04073 family)
MENALYKWAIRRKLKSSTENRMRKLIFLLTAALAAAGVTGCSGPEHKLARGIDNTMEIVRWGDMRRSVEQNAVFSAPDISYSYGVIHGFDQSISRVGLGLYEVATFPIPSYSPILTRKVTAVPQYPESYKPGLVSGSTFDTDTYTGYSGGDVAPFVPGSRFSVFDNY